MTKKNPETALYGDKSLLSPAIEIARFMIDQTPPGHTCTLYLGGVIEYSNLDDETIKELESMGVIDSRVPEAHLPQSMKKKEK